ncbi:hypothetical protein OG504_01500 [Streptomyces sp. NBC_00986]|nr:hypothetical protein OG504_01500 [Streptomyces sp. NBC_00986]
MTNTFHHGGGLTGFAAEITDEGLCIAVGIASTGTPVVSDIDDTNATQVGDYGQAHHAGGGCGEPAAGLLRPGTAGSNTAADHTATAQLALAQLPKKYRRVALRPVFRSPRRCWPTPGGIRRLGGSG